MSKIRKIDYEKCKCPVCTNIKFALEQQEKEIREWLISKKSDKYDLDTHDYIDIEEYDKRFVK